MVLGAGSAGEHFVGALRRLDRDAEFTIVERALAGGECSYYACLPTKTLLRPTEVLAAARRAPGAAEAITGEIDVERVLWWRDQVTDGRDDSWHAGWLEDQRAELVRGDARVVGRESSRSATASSSTTSSWSRPAPSPAMPPLEGLDDVEYWTNRDAIWASEVPASLVVLGGGAVGVELAQFFRRLGAEVTLVEHSDHLLARVDADAGSLLAERLRGGRHPRSCWRSSRPCRARGGGVRVPLEGAETSRPSACSSRPAAGRTSHGSDSSSSASRSRSAA